MNQLSPAERHEFLKSIEVEWQTLLQNQAVEVLSLEETARAQARWPDRALDTRWARTWKPDDRTADRSEGFHLRGARPQDGLPRRARSRIRGSLPPHIAARPTSLATIATTWPRAPFIKPKWTVPEVVDDQHHWYTDAQNVLVSRAHRSSAPGPRRPVPRRSPPDLSGGLLPRGGVAVMYAPPTFDARRPTSACR